MNHKEFSKRGGQKRWAGVSKKERSKIMSKVRRAGKQKPPKPTIEELREDIDKLDFDL